MADKNQEMREKLGLEYDAKDFQIMPPDAPFEHGFNMKTIVAALFVGLVILPGSIYLGLITGVGLGGAANWVTIILFIEIAKRSLVRLKTQEIIILYWVSGGLAIAAGGHALFGGPLGAKIWDQYLIQSPQAAGIARFIPDWVVPARGSEALIERTFFHRDWLVPLFLILGLAVLGPINSLSLGYVLFRITNDVERLPFPMEMIHAAGATALAETSNKREGWRWRVFSIGAIIGVIWGCIYVVVPTLTALFMRETIMILPIPFIDLTPSLKEILPAAVLSIATDLGALLVGFVIPFWIVIGSFIGGFIKNLLVDPLLYHYGILYRWQPGMTLIPTNLCNQLDFWMSYGIGMAFVVFVLGLSVTVKTLIQRRKRSDGSISPEREDSRIPEGRGDMKIATALALWACSTVVYIIACRILVPAFPVWICVVFGFIWSPIISYINARMIGLTGGTGGVSFPYLREGAFLLSGYRGLGIWFAPVPLVDHGAVVQTFKQLELTRTKFGSLVKLQVLHIVVLAFCSLLFWSLIWKIGPIPSSAYPFVQKMWPFSSTMQVLWVSSTLPDYYTLNVTDNAPLSEEDRWVVDFAREHGDVCVLDLELHRKTSRERSTSILDHMASRGILEPQKRNRPLLDIVKPKYIGIGFGVGWLLYALVTVFHMPTLFFYGLIAGGWSHTILPMFIGALLGRFYFYKRFGKPWRSYAPILCAGYSCGMGLVSMTSISLALIAKSMSTVVF